MQRFLSPACPRVRVIGGTRFNPDQQPAPEWAAFGSYCFALPLLEFTEASDSNLLAVTLAWDASSSGGTSSSSSEGLVVKGAAGLGHATIVEAGHAALEALGAMQPPALPSAYAMHLDRSV